MEVYLEFTGMFLLIFFFVIKGTLIAGICYAVWYKKTYQRYIPHKYGIEQNLARRKFNTVVRIGSNVLGVLISIWVITFAVYVPVLIEYFERVPY